MPLQYLEALKETVGNDKYDIALGELRVLLDHLDTQKIDALLSAEGNKDKSHLLDDWFGAFISKELKNFLIVISNENQLHVLKKNLKIIREKKFASVQTAVKLSTNLEDELRKEIFNATGISNINFLVKPELIGGVKIRINDEEIDFSIQKKLDIVLNNQ